MSEKVLTSSGVSELWDAVKNRSLPVKSVTFDEYGDMSEEEKKSETLYIVSDDTPVTCYHISNRNLLDNWYFSDPINQRGLDKYTGGYCVDRWLTTSTAKSKVSVMDGYLSVEHEADDSISCDFTQRLEDKSLAGKQVTISVLLNDNTLVQKTGILGSIMGTIGREDFTILSLAGESAIRFRIYPGYTVNAVAAKLELGPIQTLAHKEGDTWVLNDPPPDKALELAKCQRYYEETSFITQLVGSELYHDFISWKVTKRETPTVKIYSRNGEENKASYWDTSSTWVDTDIRDIRVTKDGVAIYVNRPIATNLDLIISYRICANSNL